jgi:chromosome segregation ATPase
MSMVLRLFNHYSVREMQASTTKYKNDLRVMEKDYRFEKTNQEKMMREKHGLSHDIKKLIDDNKRLEAEIHALQSNFESEKIRKERNALRLERERFEREKYDLILVRLRLDHFIYPHLFSI